MVVKKRRLICCATLAALLLFVPKDVSAKENPTITYDGSTKEFHLENVSDTDLFTNLKGLMPGDIVQQDIVLKVKNLQKETSFYLEASSEDNEEILQNMVFFVEKDNRVISREAAFEPIKLGQYNQDDTIYLTVNLEVPAESKVSNKEYHVEWDVIAQEDGKEIANKPVKTGDESRISFYLILIAISLISIVAIKKRKNCRQQRRR